MRLSLGLYLFLWAVLAPAEPALAQPSRGEFDMGFNQAWIKNDYGSSFSDEKFDEVEVRRLMRLQKSTGARVQRIWLFEGNSLNQIEWSKKGPGPIKKDVLKNYRRYMQIAKEEGVQVYLTLFDGNVTHFNPSPKQKDRYWNILNNKYGHGDRFLETVVDPVLELQKEFPDTFYGVDLVNETNAFVERVDGGPWFKDGWEGVNRFTQKWAEHIRQKHGVPVTASLGWHNASDFLLDGHLNPEHLDFFDVHAYSDTGEIRRCKELGVFAKQHGKPIILGEFGQKSAAYDNDLQVSSTKAFVENAKECGFSGALSWRLSDIRPGFNEEARFSFEAHGTTRPALETMKQLVERHQSRIQAENSAESSRHSRPSAP